MTEDTIELRPEVQQFAVLMELQLRKHDDRPGWKAERIGYLQKRLIQELEELDLDMIMGCSANKVCEEAADVANFCMMIADVYRLRHE